MKTRPQASFGAACLAALTVLVLLGTSGTTQAQHKSRQRCASKCGNDNAACMSARAGQAVGWGLTGRAWDKADAEAKAACRQAEDACMKAC